MFGVFLTFHIIVCIFLIFIVLLQSGRGAELERLLEVWDKQPTLVEIWA